MSRVSQAVRIVSAALRTNPRINPDDIPGMLRAVHTALPEDAPKPVSAEVAPADHVGDETSTDADTSTKSVSWSDAMAASRARLTPEQRVQEASEGTAAARDAVMSRDADADANANEADDEAETEAHAS